MDGVYAHLGIEIHASFWNHTLRTTEHVFYLFLVEHFAEGRGLEEWCFIIEGIMS